MIHKFKNDIGTSSKSVDGVKQNLHEIQACVDKLEKKYKYMFKDADVEKFIDLDDVKLIKNFPQIFEKLCFYVDLLLGNDKFFFRWEKIEASEIHITFAWTMGGYLDGDVNECTYAREKKIDFPFVLNTCPGCSRAMVYKKIYNIIKLAIFDLDEKEEVDSSVFRIFRKDTKLVTDPCVLIDVLNLNNWKLNKFQCTREECELGCGY